MKQSIRANISVKVHNGGLKHNGISFPSRGFLAILRAKYQAASLNPCLRLNIYCALDCTFFRSDYHSYFLEDNYPFKILQNYYSTFHNNNFYHLIHTILKPTSNPTDDFSYVYLWIKRCSKSL